jgi:hypothetical protein
LTIGPRTVARCVWRTDSPDGTQLAFAGIALLAQCVRVGSRVCADRQRSDEGDVEMRKLQVNEACSLFVERTRAFALTLL